MPVGILALGYKALAPLCQPFLIKARSFLMRPDILFSLSSPVTTLSGVGPRIAKQIAKAAGEHVVDLCWHRPSSLIDRRFSPKIAEAPDGAVATITLSVDAHLPPHNRRLPYRVRCSDETGILDLVFFHAHPDYLMKVLPEGETRIISGRVEYFRDEVQMTHPDHIATIEERDSLETVEALYPLSAGLTQKTMGKAVKAALDMTPDLPEWIDPAFFKQQKWSPWRQSLLELHKPQSEADLGPRALPRLRLAYDEILASQLALALIRAQYRRLSGRAVTGDGHLRQAALSALPFQLTASQEQALSEITGDMNSKGRMLRLLQGDVGNGKTVVAFLAMLTAAEAGTQAVIMAPTEILARQHMATIAPLAEAAGVKAVLLTGREKGKNREKILEGLATGDITLAVGTHALFQEDVAFADLSLAVIDEQHRFGVHQRILLAEKGTGTNVLVMTATPIPRTLTQAAFGDMDVSRLTEKPPGRGPVDTRVVPVSRINDVVNAISRCLARGERVYWVCPLIDESEALDLAAATERFDALSHLLGERVGLVHGAMKGKEKDAVMARFASGGITVLVATTVIEVGVDVPEATMMVVEHAERFGLAQLHQLRGRIGRGKGDSHCLLLYSPPLQSTARARLEILRASDDGFHIAEEDLRLRGAGEVLGTRQSGLPEFRLADLAEHSDLLAAAQDDARLILNRDPGLESQRGEALRVLLYLFERDSVVKYARSG